MAGAWKGRAKGGDGGPLALERATRSAMKTRRVRRDAILAKVFVLRAKRQRKSGPRSYLVARRGWSAFFFFFLFLFHLLLSSSSIINHQSSIINHQSSITDPTEFDHSAIKKMERRKVLLVFDKFKGTIDSRAASEAVKRGIERAEPGIAVECFPFSDGGDGFLQALKEPLALSIRQVRVTGPLGDPVTARYGVGRSSRVLSREKATSPHGKEEEEEGEEERIGVVEMAEAAGIVLVPDHLRNPLHTTSAGVGQIIRILITPRDQSISFFCGDELLSFRGEGCSKIILGIGGSATNDAALGMLPFLGFSIRMLDGSKVDIDSQRKLTGSDLSNVSQIDGSSILQDLGVSIQIAVDVDNPFVGDKGAVNVRLFSPLFVLFQHLFADVSSQDLLGPKGGDI